MLTRSIIDSATLQLYITYTSLARYGTKILNEEHTEAIQNLPRPKEIIFVLNGDEVGRGWTKKQTETMSQLMPHIKISTVNTPDEEDINSLVQGHEAEILTHLINERTILFSSSEEKNVEQSEIPTIVGKEKSEAIQEPETLIIPTITTTGKLNTSNADYISFVYENLLFSIIGGIALYPLDKLKITLKIQIAKSQNPLHSIRQSNLDLYSEDNYSDL